jgi:hypothetical protein
MFVESLTQIFQAESLVLEKVKMTIRRWLSKANDVIIY